MHAGSAGFPVFRRKSGNLSSAYIPRNRRYDGFLSSYCKPVKLYPGAAAQLGIFFTYVGAVLLKFTPAEAGSIAIIGGADGPTAIFVTSHLAPHMLGTIAVAAYSYMALVPVIQPPIMRALTTKGTQCCYGYPASCFKTEKILSR